MASSIASICGIHNPSECSSLLLIALHIFMCILFCMTSIYGAFMLAGSSPITYQIRMIFPAYGIRARWILLLSSMRGVVFFCV